MKKHDFRHSSRRTASRQALRGGTYALAVSAIVLAILVVINLFAAALPAGDTKLDISASKLYSITSNTKVVVNALERDVTIYWIVQSGQEDAVIENLLHKYESLSDYIQLVKKNPDIYPTFAQQYTTESVQNNSLVVECGEKSRYISLEDIYLGEVNLYTGTYTVSDFDGEGALTSAIDYVTSQDYPHLFLLEGHGEAELPERFRDQVEKENIQISSLSLLAENTIPPEADCVMIYAPASDISAEEQSLLAEYAAAGGNLLVAAGPTQEDGVLENLYSLLSNYGVKVIDGVVVEGDAAHYSGFQGPAALLPDLNSDTVTDPLLEAGYAVVMPVSLGLTVEDASQERVTALLTTSSTAFSKAAGYQLTTYEKEDGDTDGPFATAVRVESDGGGTIFWFSSSLFLEDGYNSLSSGANGDLVMNALSDLIGEREAMSIRTKSLRYNYLTISDSTASLLKVTLLGVFPLTYLGVGIAVVIRRKKVQNEAA